MPPRKRATRASKKKEEEEQVDQVDEVQEPPKKQTRRKSRNRATPNTTLDSIPGPASVLEKKAEGPESPKDPTPVKQQPKAKAKAKAATAAAAAATATATAKTTTKSSKLVPEPVKSSTPTQKVQPASQKTDTLPHQSPSKRVGIPSSRLPSPTKKQSLAGRIDPLDVKKVEAVVHKAFSSRDTAKLSGVLDDLKTTRAEQIFNDYRANAEIRFRNSDDLISSLTSRNNELANEVNSLRSHVASLEKQTSNVNEEEQFQSQLILDMMEQIVGLRIHRAQETEDALSFDCSQSGKNGILDYKLTISKEDSSEIIYTPMNASDEAEALKSYLPDYFFDNLTFPLDTLQQFYHKIYRGLNK